MRHRAVWRRCHANARAPASRRRWSWPSTVAAGLARKRPLCRAHHRRHVSCLSSQAELRLSSLRRRAWAPARARAPLAPRGPAVVACSLVRSRGAKGAHRGAALAARGPVVARCRQVRSRAAEAGGQRGSPTTPQVQAPALSTPPRRPCQPRPPCPPRRSLQPRPPYPPRQSRQPRRSPHGCRPRRLSPPLGVASVLTMLSARSARRPRRGPRRTAARRRRPRPSRRC